MGQAASKEYSRVESTDHILLDTMDESESEEELFPVMTGDKTLLTGHHNTTEERWYVTLLQIFVPFLVAGLGMVAAGLVLDIVQHWSVFIQVSEFFILVPALLGLKGNLEMTLASRLSTAANLGKLDTRGDCVSLVGGNLALVQCQAIVVGFLASVNGVLMGYMKEHTWSLKHGLLLCASSVVTASVASFLLGLVMVLVILASRHCNINPDNVATPIAASLGDLITLSLLAWIADKLWADMAAEAWLAPLLITSYLLLTPILTWVAWRNINTREALLHGWTPVILSMLLSSGGGLILDYAQEVFNGIAVFQPVMNGVGGNLVAVQASRMSTSLHTGHSDTSLERSCVSPWSALCSTTDQHSHTAKLLLTLVIPGHLIFTAAISGLEAGHTSPTPLFLVTYIMAALLQVSLLLYICRVIVFAMWRHDIDPDNCAIPYLTALGDLLGGAFLSLAFLFLHMAGEVVPSIIDEDITASSSVPSIIDSNFTSTTATTVLDHIVNTTSIPVL